MKYGEIIHEMPKTRRNATFPGMVRETPEGCVYSRSGAGIHRKFFDSGIGVGILAILVGLVYIYRY